MSTTETRSGLIANGRALPLEGVRVDGTLRGAGLEVTLTQRFRNDEAVPIADEIWRGILASRPG